MGRGDRSVTFIEEYRITTPWSTRKLLAKSQVQTQEKGNRDVEQVSNVDYITTNANASRGESQLYIFEDNEAVIKMIIKGRNPTMRHVSRTHRVAVNLPTTSLPAAMGCEQWAAAWSNSLRLCRIVLFLVTLYSTMQSGSRHGNFFSLPTALIGSDIFGIMSTNSSSFHCMQHIPVRLFAIHPCLCLRSRCEDFCAGLVDLNCGICITFLIFCQRSLRSWDICACVRTRSNVC